LRPDFVPIRYKLLLGYKKGKKKARKMLFDLTIKGELPDEAAEFWANNMGMIEDGVVNKSYFYKKMDLVAADDAKKLFSDVDALGVQVRKEAEDILRERLTSIEKYLSDENTEQFASLNHIFKKYR